MHESALGLSQKHINELSRDSLTVAGDGMGRVVTKEFAMYISFELLKKTRDPNWNGQLAAARASSGSGDLHLKPSPPQNQGFFNAFGMQSSAPNLFIPPATGSSAAEEKDDFDPFIMAPLNPIRASDRPNKRAIRAKSAVVVPTANRLDPFQSFNQAKDPPKESDQFMATLYDQFSAQTASPRPPDETQSPADFPTPPGPSEPLFDEEDSGEVVRGQPPQPDNDNWDPFKEKKDANASSGPDPSQKAEEKEDIFGLQAISEDSAVSHPRAKTPPDKSARNPNHDDSSDDDSSSSVKLKHKHTSQPSGNKLAIVAKIHPRAYETAEKSRTNALLEMRRGTAMLKYGRRGFPHFRRFQISSDNSRFQWYSRKKSLSNTSILISDIHEIASGQTTDVFKKCKQMALAKASFSVIYGSKRKSLDVVAKSPDEAKMWVTGLQKLLATHRAGRDLSKLEYIDAGVVFKDITRPGYSVSREKQKRSREGPQAFVIDIQTQTRKGGRGSRSHSVQLQRVTPIPDVTFRRDGQDGPPREENKPLRKAIEKDVGKIKKAYDRLLTKSRNPKISQSSEFVTISTLLAELEQRIEDCEQILADRQLDIHVVKRDVWILKVDIYALEDFVMVITTEDYAKHKMLTNGDSPSRGRTV